MTSVDRQPKRPRVLLAEDHPGVAKAVSRVLTLDCDVVESIADGTQVLEAAQRSGTLVARLGLTDAKGHPLCASVRPPRVEWSAG